MKRLLRKFKIKDRQSGQSFVELAIILPLLLLMLVGMVEVAFTMFIYLTELDLTREAARFASVRDFNELEPSGELHPADSSDACTDSDLHYFLDASCFFTDPDLNPFLPFNIDTDDVVITVFTVAGGQISERHPTIDDDGQPAGYWSLNDDNWTRDCNGNTVRTAPFFSDDDVEANFISDAPLDKGLVLVEAYYCWNPVAYLPFISEYIPSTLQLHAYTFMPSPEAIPTPTPIVSSP